MISERGVMLRRGSERGRVGRGARGAWYAGVALGLGVPLGYREWIANGWAAGRKGGLASSSVEEQKETECRSLGVDEQKRGKLSPTTAAGDGSGGCGQLQLQCRSPKNNCWLLDEGR